MRWKWDQRSNNDSPLQSASIQGGGRYGGEDFQIMHINRAYPISEFLAYSMATVNFAYHLPLNYYFKSFYKKPIFINKSYLSLVSDISMMDGFYFDVNQSSYISDSWKTTFASIGMEYRLETKLAYLLPFEVVVGIYMGNQEKADGDVKLALDFLFSAF